MEPTRWPIHKPVTRSMTQGADAVEDEAAQALINQEVGRGSDNIVVATEAGSVLDPDVSVAGISLPSHVSTEGLQGEQNPQVVSSEQVREALVSESLNLTSADPVVRSVSTLHFTPSVPVFTSSESSNKLGGAGPMSRVHSVVSDPMVSRSHLVSSDLRPSVHTQSLPRITGQGYLATDTANIHPSNDP